MEKNLGEDMRKILAKVLNINSEKWQDAEVRMLSPLQLAYIGDAVYELFVRSYIMLQNNLKVNDLHKEAVKFVKAKAQAQIILALETQLTEEEWGIVKRGRNAKINSAPKNANLSEYRYATGFESLIGYLYLTGQDDRLSHIFEVAVKEVKGDL